MELVWADGNQQQPELTLVLPLAADTLKSGMLKRLGQTPLHVPVPLDDDLTYSPLNFLTHLLLDGHDCLALVCK